MGGKPIFLVLSLFGRCKFSIEKFFSHRCAGAAKSFFVPPSNKVIKKKFFQDVDKAFCNAMKTAKIGG